MIAIVVFTAVMGDTDRLQPPAVVDPKARYVCFSDQPCTVAPYEWIPVPAADDPKLAARQIKIAADHPVLAGARATLWHDASYRLLVEPRWALRWLREADLVGMAHPSRTLIEHEAIAIARYGYLTQEAAEAIVAEYRADGYTDARITSSGLLGRRVSEPMRRFNAAWWTEVQRWRGRDQPSLDYLAWKLGVRVEHVPGSVRKNPFAAWRVMPEAVSA